MHLIFIFYVILVSNAEEIWQSQNFLIFTCCGLGSDSRLPIPTRRLIFGGHVAILWRHSSFSSRSFDKKLVLRKSESEIEFLFHNHLTKIAFFMRHFYGIDSFSQRFHEILVFSNHLTKSVFFLLFVCLLIKFAFCLQSANEICIFFSFSYPLI